MVRRINMLTPENDASALNVGCADRQTQRTNKESSTLKGKGTMAQPSSRAERYDQYGRAVYKST